MMKYLVFGFWLLVFPLGPLYAKEQPALTIGTNDLAQGQSIPRGAQRVPMLEITLAASCAGTIPIEAIEITRAGRGKTSDILRIYALEGALRLTRAATISSSEGTAQIRFQRFHVPACAERTLTIVADFSPTADVAAEHQLVLSELSDISAEGALLRSAEEEEGAEARRVAGMTTGSISVTYLPLHRDPRYGSREIVARLKLTADGTDDHRIRAITFTNDGSASDADLRNLFLEKSGGKRLSLPQAKLRGDRVRVAIDPPLFLGKNDTVTLQLRADVRASRKRTIRFLIEEPGDIEAEAVRGR